MIGRFCVAALVALLWAGGVGGAVVELQVLSAGAVRSVVTELAAAYEKETGNAVKLTFGTVGVIRSKLAGADPAQGATRGIHFAGVLQRLGIADAVKAKTTLVPGGYPAELVARGEVEMVVHQISEIVPVKGVTLVGPLPNELQKVTVYGAGVAVASTSKDAARAFVAFLARPAFKPKLAAAGLDYTD